MNSFYEWLNSFGLTPVALEEGGTFWLPPQASNFANDIDWIFYFIYWVSVFFFVLIVGVMIYFIWKYRAREGHKEEKTSTHNTALEVTWSVIPLLIVLLMFYYGFKGYVDKLIAPQNSYTITVYGQKWQWFFEYPNGYQHDELHIPVDTDVRLVMTSNDVTHSLYIPSFRVKKDVVPGRFTNAWFRATETGDFQVFCAEYCGTSHSDMITRAVVHKRGDFDKWLADAANFIAKDPPAVAGEKLYKKKGCAQCHSIDGTSGHGPSFKDIWGKEEALANGETVVVDEEYIRNSILNPMDQIRAGYEAVMPTYQGKITDMEILALIAYIKTLSGIEVSEVPIPEQLGQVESATDTVDSATGTQSTDEPTEDSTPNDSQGDSTDNEGQNE